MAPPTHGHCRRRKTAVLLLLDQYARPLRWRGGCLLARRLALHRQTWHLSMPHSCKHKAWFQEHTLRQQHSRNPPAACIACLLTGRKQALAIQPGMCSLYQHPPHAIDLQLQRLGQVVILHLRAGVKDWVLCLMAEHKQCATAADTSSCFEESWQGSLHHLLRRT